MTLAEAIEEVKAQSEQTFDTFGCIDIRHIGISDIDDDAVMREAIATILNAVVKGELK